MFSILSKTASEQLEFLTQEIARQCPRLKIGEKVTTLHCRVSGGKMFPETLKPVYGLDFFPDELDSGDLVEETEGIHVHEAKLFFSELNDLRDFAAYVEAEHGVDVFIHPYKILIPHVLLLSNQKVGDSILAIDRHGEARKVTLTEQLLKAHSYLIFKFAVSR